MNSYDTVADAAAKAKDSVEDSAASVFIILKYWPAANQQVLRPGTAMQGRQKGRNHESVCRGNSLPADKKEEIMSLSAKATVSRQTKRKKS